MEPEGSLPCLQVSATCPYPEPTPSSPYPHIPLKGTCPTQSPIIPHTKYRISRPIRRTVIFSLEILEKNNDECILILVIYWKKTGLLHTKISNHNIIYSS